MKTIINCNIVLEDSIIYHGFITFDNEKIIDFGKIEKFILPKTCDVIDAKGLYLIPGMIDIHNHGSQKDLFINEPIKCIKHFLSHGETTILPTLYSNLTKEQMFNGIKKILDSKTSKYGDVIEGIYMEGPYMNGEGSNQKYICWNDEISLKEYKDLVDFIGDFAKIWAIDPARKNISEFMKYVELVNPKAIFAMGHSHATAEDCVKLNNFNLKLQTHHQDSGKAPKTNQVTIGAGCDEYSLYNQDVFIELISDEAGVHVPPYLQKMSVKIKGIEKIILITDSMPSLGDYKNNTEEGVLYGSDLNYDYEGHLAGSHLTLDKACQNFMANTGYGICHAVRCVTINPAKLLGISDKLGSIEKGKIPNLLLIDDLFNIKKVFLKGGEIF